MKIACSNEDGKILLNKEKLVILIKHTVGLLLYASKI